MYFINNIQIIVPEYFITLYRMFLNLTYFTYLKYCPSIYLVQKKHFQLFRNI